MNISLDENWRSLLRAEFEKDYFKRLWAFVENEYVTRTIYPRAEHIFRALNETPLDAVKVVILGQDPYHEPNQAQGLAFYVPPEVSAPPSLVNIGKELGHVPDLLRWARQGVLLLNATLTVAAHAPLSHQRRGWETFTDAVIRLVAAKRDSIVFLLWGANAQKKASFIDSSRHLVLTAPHPSPLSAYRGFFGCGHFGKANDYLKSHGLTPIDF